MILDILNVIDKSTLQSYTLGFFKSRIRPMIVS